MAYLDRTMTRDEYLALSAEARVALLHEEYDYAIETQEQRDAVRSGLRCLDAELDELERS